MTAPHGVVNSSATGVGGRDYPGLSVNSTTYRDAPGGGLVGWSFSNPDYASQSGDATVTIDQAGSTVTVTPALSSVTYDASSRTTATWASTGTDDKGGSLTVTYGGIDGTELCIFDDGPHRSRRDTRPRPASRATRTTRGSTTRPTSPSPRPRPRSRSRASAAL